jgi:hypothetical protein
MARYLVLTGYDDNMQEVGDRCAATHRAYAERRGYDQETVRHYVPGIHPSYQKVAFLAERIADYDAILWLDADSVVMGDMDIDHFAGAGKVMDISVDWCAWPHEDDNATITTLSVSCGTFILWRTPDLPRFMDTWYRYGERYASRNICCWEQDGLRAAIGNDKWMNARVRRHPRRTLNAVHHSCTNVNFPQRAPKPYEPGDFLLHLTNVDRIAILNALNL